MKTIIKQPCTLFDGVKTLGENLSHTTCKSWIKTGRITVNGMSQNDQRFGLYPNDVVALESKKMQLYPGVEILYHDKDCVVLTKPQGLLAVDSLDPSEISLHAILKAYFKPYRVYPVQRLDEGTSGVMIYALNREFKDALKEQFEKHTITREYQAIVVGTLEKKSGRWKSFLKEDKQYFVHVVDKNGEEAITDYRVLKEKNGYSLVNFKLFTGRKNQIRVQAAHHQVPILGDTKYGGPDLVYKRLALHAHTLGFYHPYLKKQLSFTIPTPFTLDHVLPI
jgi:23S rRNA pseudouridine1911/1915/1917 synthase